MENLESRESVRSGTLKYQAMLNRYGTILRPPMELLIEFSYDESDPESTVKFIRAVDERGIEHDYMDFHLSSILHAFKIHLNDVDSAP